MSAIPPSVQSPAVKGRLHRMAIAGRSAAIKTAKLGLAFGASFALAATFLVWAHV